MQLSAPIFPQTVIRVLRPDTDHKAKDYVLFRIYGVEQALHVIDPTRIVPRNDNVRSGVKAR